jgi:hypothetical protein
MKSTGTLTLKDDRVSRGISDIMQDQIGQHVQVIYQKR